MKDTVGKSGKVSFMISAVGSMTGASTTGQIKGLFTKLCLNSEAGTAGSAVLSTACGASSTQDWAFQAGAGPGSAGEILGNGLCLGLSSGRGVLAACGPSSTRWFAVGFGLFENASTRTCLNDTTSGAQVRLTSCANIHGDVFSTPAGQVTSGVTGLCLDNPNGTQATVDTCGTGTDNWLQPANNFLLKSSANGLCARAGSPLDNTPVTVSTTCSATSARQAWFWGPGGELINAASGLCLADPSGTPGSGDGLELEDCYGLPGEIWAFN